MTTHPRRLTRAVAAAAVAVLATAALQACGDGADPPAPGATPAVSGEKVVGYFVQWGAGRDYRVKNVQTSGSATKLTHLVYAFGKVADGRCAVGDSFADHEQVYSAAQSVDGVADTRDQPLRGHFHQLRKLKKLNPHLKVIWSFGGYQGSAGFAQAARDPATFADSCHTVVEDPRWADVFDGIDIDWEYPNACGLTCDRSGPDALRNLLSPLRSAFGTGALVTAAITADGTDGGRIDAADYAGAAASLDWVMVMTYDYAGTGSPRGPTAPHSPLTAYPGIANPGFTAEAAIRKLRAKGIPPGKLLLGLGFYGRGWTGVTQAEPGGTATGAGPGRYEPGIEDYKLLAQRCPPTGTLGGTAYAFCGDQWWSYDTPQTVTEKMAYARAQGLGGGFFWELSGDTDDGQLVSAMRSGLG